MSKQKTVGNRLAPVPRCDKMGGVGSWNEEEVPSDLIASRVGEAALLFDIMKYGYKETRNG